MLKLMLMSAGVLVALAGCCGRTVADLSCGGRTDYSIVIAADAPQPDRFAADELKAFLEQSTGATFPVVTDGKASGRTIELGTAKARRLIGEGRVDALREEESVYAVKDGTLAICGGGAPGLAYGVYSFLERELGCRWFTTMGDNLVPSHPNLRIAEKTVTDRPRLDYRCLLTVEGGKDRDSIDHLFLYRNRINLIGGNYANLKRKDLVGSLVPRLKQITPMCHSLFFYIPPKEYFKDHPDYYTQDAAGKRTAFQLCFSNPALRRELTRKFLEHVGRNGGEGFFDISQQDAGQSLCHCDGCKALEKRYGSVGGPLFDFLLELSPKLKARHPKAIVHTLAYHKSTTQHPPKNVDRLPDNVGIVFAPLDDDFMKDLSHPHNAESRADLKRWCELGRVWLWAYPAPYSSPTPPYAGLGRSAADVRIAADLGLTGSYHEHDVGTAYGGGFSDLQTWLLVQAFQDPDRDWRELREEFCRFYYGPVAGEMVEYEEFLETERETWPGYVGFLGKAAGFFTPRSIVRWQAHFDRMEAKAGGDAKLLQRIREVRLPLEMLTATKWRELAKAGLTTGGSLSNVCDRALAAYWTAVERRTNLPGRKIDRNSPGTGWISGYPRFLEEARRMAEIEVKPLPAEFADIPEDRIRQVFIQMGGGPVKRVEMPDAATGYALVETDVAPQYVKPPITAGFYDRTNHKYVINTQIGASEIVPGKFHLYKLGRGQVPSSECTFWIGHSWRMGLLCGDCYFPGVTDEWDMYVSLKFEGPAYDPKSTLKDSAIYFDRAVFVKR